MKRAVKHDFIILYKWNLLMGIKSVPQIGND